MENKFERASHYIQMTRLYIRVNDLETAWKFAVKIYRLFPITESRRELQHLFIKLGIKRRIVQLIYTFKV